MSPPPQCFRESELPRHDPENRAFLNLLARAAVGAWVCAHSPVSCRGQVGQLADEPAIFIKKQFGLVAFHPGFQHFHVLRFGGQFSQRDLVCAPRSFDL